MTHAITNLHLRKYYNGRPCPEATPENEADGGKVHVWGPKLVSGMGHNKGCEYDPEAKLSPAEGSCVLFSQQECAICWDSRAIIINHAQDECEDADRKMADIIMGGVLLDGVNCIQA